MPTRRRSWSAERLAGNLRRDGLGGRRELRQDGRGASRGQHPPPRALVILLDSPSARTGPVHRGIWSWPVEATCSKRSSCGGTRVIPNGGHQIPAVRAAVAAPPESPRGSARAPLLAPGSSSPAARLCSQRSSPPGAHPPTRDPSTPRRPPQRESSWSLQPRTNRGRRVLLGNEVLDFLPLSSINRVPHQQKCNK
jgi:hypothetical protein